MVARAYTVAFEGVEARLVEVQCALSPGLPSFTLVGLPVLLIGAPLGLGAWVSARRDTPRDVADTPAT